nr:hypothetical protein [Tanacetum cinerariifolium]
MWHECRNLPFVKCTPLWHTIESMKVFQNIPQNPHFRPLLGVKESAREGMAIGTMVKFSSVMGRTYCLRVDSPRSDIEDFLETLVELESNGFDVEIRQLEEERKKVLQKKEKWILENDAMKAAEEAIEQELWEVAAKFDGLAAAQL